MRHGSRNWKAFVTNLSILLGSVVFLFFVSEITLRFFYPQPIDYFIFKRQPDPGTTYHRWGIEVRINSHGFRDHEYSVEKHPGVIRIAALGDSITHGYGVHVDETFHKQLEAILNNGVQPRKYEVPAFNVNVGDTQKAIETYENVGRLFHPDVVILGFCLNDFLDYREGPPPTLSFKRRFYNVLGTIHHRLRSLSHVYFFAIERSRRFLYKYSLFDITIRRYNSWLPVLRPDSPEFKRRFTSTVRKLNQLNDLVKLDGARLIVLIFPYEVQLHPKYVEIYKREYSIEGLQYASLGFAQTMLTTELVKHDIEYVNLLEPFQKAVQAKPGLELYFRQLGNTFDWIHPNKSGHDIAAREIALYIKKRT